MLINLTPISIYILYITYYIDIRLQCLYWYFNYSYATAHPTPYSLNYTFFYNIHKYYLLLVCIYIIFCFKCQYVCINAYVNVVYVVHFFIVTVHNLCQTKKGIHKWQPVQVHGTHTRKTHYTRSNRAYLDWRRSCCCSFSCCLVFIFPTPVSCVTSLRQHRYANGKKQSNKTICSHIQ